MIEYDEDFEEMMVFCDEDGCDGETMLHGSWRDCIYEAKQAGWKMTSERGVDMHSCPRHRYNFD